LITKSGVKLGHILTTKRGDSGSRRMLGEKCVMIEAPNLDTKIDQNSSQQQKINKIDQKSQIIKISKITKTQKVTKSTKPENQKTRKSEKVKNAKVKSEKTPKPEKGQNVT